MRFRGLEVRGGGGDVAGRSVRGGGRVRVGRAIFRESLSFLSFADPRMNS